MHRQNLEELAAGVRTVMVMRHAAYGDPLSEAERHARTLAERSDEFLQECGTTRNEVDAVLVLRSLDRVKRFRLRSSSIKKVYGPLDIMGRMLDMTR